jgi:hypothetical protein
MRALSATGSRVVAPQTGRGPTCSAVLFDESLERDHFTLKAVAVKVRVQLP